jgi:hypothetical protein
MIFRLTNKEEWFNLRHSSLRTTVARLFGILKCRFQILSHAPEFLFSTPVKLVYATTALYNFISSYEGSSLDFGDDLGGEKNEENLSGEGFIMVDSVEIKRKRNEISQKMWEDYLRFRI